MCNPKVSHSQISHLDIRKFYAYLRKLKSKLNVAYSKKIRKIINFSLYETTENINNYLFPELGDRIYNYTWFEIGFIFEINITFYNLFESLIHTMRNTIIKI